MMRSSFVATTGLKLARTPSVREQARRRLLVVAGAIVSLAAVSIAIGLATAPPEAARSDVRTGPFSYFPSE